MPEGKVSSDILWAEWEVQCSNSLAAGKILNKHFFLIFRNQHCPKRASTEGQPKYSRNERLARKINDLFVVEVEPAGR